MLNNHHNPKNKPTKYDIGCKKCVQLLVAIIRSP